MGDSVDEHLAFPIVNLVQDPILAHTHPPLQLVPFSFRAP